MRGPHCVHELTRALLSSARAFDGHAFARDRHSLRRLISEPSVRGLTAKTPKRQKRGRRLGFRAHERSNATLPTNSGAREAQHASRLSARQALQPHARKLVELSDLGTIRSRSANEARPRELTEQARAISQRSAGGQASQNAARPKNLNSRSRARSAACPARREITLRAHSEI